MADHETMEERVDETDMPISPRSGTLFIPEEDPTVMPARPEQLEQRIEEDERRYGQVRFLNASTGNTPFNIMLDNHMFTNAVEFASVTPYVRVEDGFHTITISGAMNPRMVFYQKPVPFLKGEPVTMVIVDDINDIDLVQISDKGVANMGKGNGCLRASNMSYGDSAYDVVFYSGDTVFANIRFRETTFFRKAAKDQYQLFISQAVNGFERKELEIIEAKDPPYELGIFQPLHWFTVTIEPERNYTAYIIGNQWSTDSLRVLVVENP